MSFCGGDQNIPISDLRAAGINAIKLQKNASCRKTLFMSRPPPTPSHILRSHTAEITSLSLSDDNERLYSTDASGTVVISSTRTTRPIASWKAHTASILGAEEWEDKVVTFVCALPILFSLV
jgi:WD40 repeat protein